MGGGQTQDSPRVAVRVEGSGCTQEKLDQMWGCGASMLLRFLVGATGRRNRLWREIMTSKFLAMLV